MKFPSKANSFMRKLQNNNERDWFNANKDTYTSVHGEVKAFAKTCFENLAQHDVLVEGKSPVMRIYRDTRFSKDKTPYKRHWGGGMDRLGAERRGGYYWHVEPGGIKQWDGFETEAHAFVGGGFWAPESKDLKRIREEIAIDYEAFRKLLDTDPIKSTFGGLHQGNKLKTSPKGFDKTHPAIDLLNHKAFVLVRHFSKADVEADDFSEKVAQTFADMRPFLDYMSNVLTTDSNGISLL
ncbi:MAG: DUF2461 domain-containing protein [Saprospiraceae bacterium]